MPTVVAEPKNANEMSFQQRARDLAEMDRRDQEELRRERKSPFSSFYQVNKDNSEYLRSCLDENPKALKILFSSSTTWTSTMRLYVLTRYLRRLLE